MVDEIKETKEEKIWKLDPPVCPNCGYPHAQPPKCIACGQKLVEEEEPEEPEKPEGEEKPEGLDELLKKTRDELDTMAEEKGLNHGDYHNKEEIAKAILESKSEEEKPEGAEE